MSADRVKIKARRRKVPKYVNEIPYPNRREICRILDGDGSGDWKELAHECGFSQDQINTWSLAFQRPGGSATDSVLTTWSHQLPTIKDLFYIFIKIKNIRALQSLRDFVDQSMFDHPDLQRFFPRRSSRVSDDSNDSCDSSVDSLPLPPVRNRPVQNSESVDSSGFPIPVASHSSSSSNSAPNSASYMPSLKSEAACSIEKTNGATKFSDLEYQQKSVLSTLRQYSYREIEHATNKLNADNLLGKGGFGTVFRGVITKSLVAIKLLNQLEDKSSDDKLIINKRHFAEIKAALSYQHKNIIQILGYSIDGPCVCLVHQFMANGSLDDRLSCEDGTEPLQWLKRHEILMGAARGLQYLHKACEKPLIHGDIKSANILLDEHLEPKIGDFGLSKMATSGTQTGVYTHASRSDMRDKVFGSEAYLPDDFARTLKHSIATDTYSFGIVIYEVCSGEKSYDERREGGKLLKEYVDSIRMTQNEEMIFDIRDRFAQDWPRSAWMPLLEIGHECAARFKIDRPKMSEVLNNLEKLHCKIQLLTYSPPILSEEESYNLFHTSHPGPFSLTADNHSPHGAGKELPQSLKLVESLQKLCMEDPSMYGSDSKKLAMIEEFDNMQSFPTLSTVEIQEQCRPYQLQRKYDQRKSESDDSDGLKLDSFVPPPSQGSLTELKGESHDYINVPQDTEARQNEANSHQENECFGDSQERKIIMQKREKSLPSFDDDA